MPKLPVLSANKVVKALKRAGFKIVRQSGSHIHLWHNKRRILVTVPNHKELAKGTLNAIIKQSKMSREKFLSFVR
jgi:predicted RNA binding protein YcfA (HicA-like mRNA interferase family)